MRALYGWAQTKIKGTSLGSFPFLFWGTIFPRDYGRMMLGIN
jgi:hypothetical protein